MDSHLVLAVDHGHDEMRAQCECKRLTVAVTASELRATIEFACPYCQTRIAFLPRDP